MRRTVTEASLLSAADLHKDSSNSFALYKKRPIKVQYCIKMHVYFACTYWFLEYAGL